MIVLVMSRSQWSVSVCRLYLSVVGAHSFLRLTFAALPSTHDSTGRPFHPHSFLKSNIRCHLLTVDRLKIVFSILDSDFWILNSDVFESAGICMIHHIVDTVLHCAASFIS